MPIFFEVNFCRPSFAYYTNYKIVYRIEYQNVKNIKSNIESYLNQGWNKAFSWLVKSRIEKFGWELLIYTVFRATRFTPLDGTD